MDYTNGQPVKDTFDLATDKLVSIIVPLRVCSDRPDALDRLAHSFLDEEFPRSEIELVFVDDGSPEEDAKRIVEKAKELGAALIQLDTELEPFSAARCRNVAASRVASKYIFFQDLDLMPTNRFYRNLLKEITVHELEDNPNDFVMFGVVYLTAHASLEFLDCESRKRESFFYKGLLNDPVFVEKTSTGTSCVLMHRNTYLVRGGMDERFEAWGYEDLEFETRIARLSKKFPLPDEWLKDEGTFSSVNQYRGWKAMLRLFGDLTWNRGYALFHRHHPVDRNSGYQLRRRKNYELFRRCMARFVSHQEEPLPLPDLTKGKTLVFTSNAFLMNRGIRPALGEVIREEVSRFDKKGLLRAFIEKQSISRVMFFNPYASEAMIRVYEECRADNIPYIVAERGGLPNSFFYDPNGFLSDSSSYDKSHWDSPLSSTEREEIKNWIIAYKQGAEDLERQPNRVGARELRKQLGVPYSRRIIFVPFQRPSDTVTNYFTGRLASYGEFIEQIRMLAQSLPSEYALVYKVHPLEDEGVDVPGATNAANANIRDLIEACDAVVTFNSGTGLLALIYERPVYVFGHAYYCHPGLAMQVTDYKDVIADLGRSAFSKECMLRFLYYLVMRFYSFGRLITKEVEFGENGRITATTDIQPEVIRAQTLDYEVNLRAREGVLVGRGSLLFDRFKASPTGNRSLGNSPRNLTKFERKLLKLKRQPLRFFLDSNLFRKTG